MDKAYRLTRDLSPLDEGDLQYRLNVGLGTFYRVKKALLAVHQDIVFENGFFKVRPVQKGMIVSEHWGELEPDDHPRVKE